MNILVTGNLGYIGQVLVPMLIDKGHNVTGLDAHYYPATIKVDNKILQIKKDIRDVEKSDFKDIDAVVHLAALSNDPTGELNRSWTEDINYKSTISLAKLAKSAGVSKFIFSSSCSVYGFSEKTMKEDSVCNPISEYARSKYMAESDLKNLNDENFSVLILRNGTVYGASARMRLDLVINNMVAHAIAFGHVKILSDGSAWRPMIHTKDVSNAFIKMLDSSLDKSHAHTFNVGGSDQNFQVSEMARVVQKTVPNTEIKFAGDAQKDARSYFVDFSKISSIGFKPKISLDEGTKEIYDFLVGMEFDSSSFNKSHFFNLNLLKEYISNGKVDKTLRLV